MRMPRPDADGAVSQKVGGISVCPAAWRADDKEKLEQRPTEWKSGTAEFTSKEDGGGMNALN